LIKNNIWKNLVSGLSMKNILPSASIRKNNSNFLPPFNIYSIRILSFWERKIIICGNLMKLLCPNKLLTTDGSIFWLYSKSYVNSFRMLRIMDLHFLTWDGIILKVDRVLAKYHFLPMQIVQVDLSRLLMKIY
jgi:hypothetical protein